MRWRPDVVYHSITKSVVLYSKTPRNFCLATSLYNNNALSKCWGNITLLASGPFSLYLSHGSKNSSLITIAMLCYCSIRKQCAGQSTSNKFCYPKALIEATKLRMEWHRFGYSCATVPPSDCLEELFAPSCSQKGTCEVAAQSNGLREQLRWSGSSIPKQR